MSVMLSTTNPAAAHAMEPHRDRRAPYQGQVVLFHLRPGEGRGGKLFAPAVITRVEDDDHVELMVIHAADDFITRWKIPRKTEQNPVNCWSFTDWDEKHYRPDGEEVEPPKPEGHLTWDDVIKMHGEIAVLRNKIATLENGGNERQAAAQLKLERAQQDMRQAEKTQAPRK